jgi:hypothetical protein
MNHSVQGDAQVLEFLYDGDLKYVRWTMYPTGWLEMDYSYSLKGTYDFTGITFDYPESTSSGFDGWGTDLTGYGRNRPQGTTFDVRGRLYNNTQTGAFPGSTRSSKATSAIWYGQRWMPWRASSSWSPMKKTCS